MKTLLIKEIREICKERSIDSDGILLNNIGIKTLKKILIGLTYDSVCLKKPVKTLEEVFNQIVWIK